jgi:hypothetical protein
MAELKLGTRSLRQRQPPKPVLALGYLLVLASGLTALGQHALDWFTLDGGGGTSTGGVYAVTGSIGQPDAGGMNGGQFTLSGGFWPGLIVPPPSLFIQVSGDSVVIAWSPVTLDFELEETADLAGAVWTAAPAGNPVTISITGTAKFYRLRKP